MKKKIIFMLVLSLLLTACGREAEPRLAAELVLETPEPVQMEAVPSQEPEPTLAPTKEPEPTPAEKPHTAIWSYDWSAEESYILAKIAMAEAEDEDTEGKALVILVVLNRVWNEDFPDTIEEVVMQDNPVQFSPVANGRYDRVEPDDDCWKALDMVMGGWDESRGALYFESPSESTWHQQNLKYLFQHGNHYFYTEKEGKP